MLQAMLFGDIIYIKNHWGLETGCPPAARLTSALALLADSGFDLAL